MELLWKGSNDKVGARQTRHTCKRAATEDSKDWMINVLTDVQYREDPSCTLRNCCWYHWILEPCERERERESTETPLPMMELASNETIHTLLPWWRWELAAAANQ